MPDAQYKRFKQCRQVKKATNLKSHSLEITSEHSHRYSLLLLCGQRDVSKGGTECTRKKGKEMDGWGQRSEGTCLR